MLKPGPKPATQRWDELLDAALSVFNRDGYERSSVADIASAAGLAKPSVYHYVDSKEDLLEAIIIRSHERLASQLHALPASDSALEMVWQILYTHVLFNIDFAAETSLMLADFRMLSGNRRRGITGMLNAYDRTLRALVEEAQRRGEADPTVDARLAVMSILGGANYVARWYRPRPGADASQVARNVADLGIGGLLGAASAWNDRVALGSTTSTASFTTRPDSDQS